MTNSKPPAKRSELEGFLRKVAETPPSLNRGEPGRLIFAMDATASREPTWDNACHLQAEMFMSTTDLGNLEVQLCYYRGFNEFNKSPWCSNSKQLLKQMTAVSCLGGHTQIARLLRHGLAEHQLKKVQALVFVGDALEENPDDVCHLAGQAGLKKLPLFLFQEGYNPGVASTFKQMAHLSGGAYAPFDSGSAEQLKSLLRAVAVYAVGGRKALENYAGRQTGDGILKLSHQMNKSRSGPD